MISLVTKEELGNSLKYDSTMKKVDVSTDGETIGIKPSGEIYKIPKQPITFSANEFVWSNNTNVTYPSILSPSNVEINTWGGYDKNSGIFTAPKSGIYLFSASIARNTIVAKDEKGKNLQSNSSVRKEDMLFNFMKYSTSQTPSPDRSTGHRFGEIWIGQVNTKVNQTWQRGSGATNVITHLNKGEKVTLEFGIWDGAKNGYTTELSYSLSGYMIQ